jgi:hypothetical protein
MSILRLFEPSRARGDRKLTSFVARIERLEGRSLLSSMSLTFQVPSLTELYRAAGHRVNTVPMIFSRMVGALQVQIDLNAPRGTPAPQLTATVDQLADSFESAARNLFAATNPHLYTLLRLQGEQIRSAINSEKIQLDTQLVPTSGFNESAFLSIQELTLSRKLWPAGTPAEDFLIGSLVATATLDTVLANQTLPVPPTPLLTDAQAAAVVSSEAYAYQTDMLLAATQNPLIRSTVNGAVGSLVTRVDAAVGSGNFPAQLSSAEQSFDATLVGPGGLFGPGGPFSHMLKQPPNVSQPLSIGDAATFTNLQYREIQFHPALNAYRYFSVQANEYGRFLSTQYFVSPAQAVRKAALDQSWYHPNPAYFVAFVTIPANYTIYVGTAAPIYQGIYRREPTPSIYPGGGSQILVLNRYAPQYHETRATGT